jgi:hypothetical protein
VPLVIKSRSCRNAGFWTKHLQKADTNERVEIIGFFGLSAETIKDAFSEMRGMARASKNCDNYFSQYNINPRADEHLTEAQWDEAHALHRKNHGLDHLPYFRVRHVKRDEQGNLREHEHGIALRVDPTTGKAISDSLTAAINERTSRDLEIRFGLESGHSVLTPDREQQRPERRPKKHESFRAERSGIDPETVKADARAARQRADNGQSFRAALEETGAYILARGDRRDFVIIDRNGDDHSLGRRLGMKTAELRAFMADLDPASLPSVAEAKAQQQAERAPSQENARTGGPDNDRQRPHFNGSSRRRRKMATEREDATDPATVRRQISDQQDFAAQARESSELSERFLAGVKRAQEDGEKLREAEQWAGQKAAQEDDIADAHSRYAQAAGDRYDIRRPYSSLSEVVGLEGAMFQREQEKLRRDAAHERDPEQRELLELRRQIEANDYMAITSDRLASMSRIITGNSNSEESQRQEQRAEYFAAEALELRQQRQELQDRIERRETAREIDADIEMARKWIDKHGGEKAATEQDNQPTPETPREAVETQYAAAGASAPAEANTRTSEAERPAEVIYFGPTRPEPEAQPSSTSLREVLAAANSARENTDARQVESTTAENVEITDVKAAKKAALAQAHAETEQSIAHGIDRGSGYSR